MLIFFFHFFLFLQTVTNTTSGEKYRPSFTHLGSNLKKAKIWKSIEVHAIYSLYFIIGYSREGLQVWKDFLNSDYKDIYDPIFLAQMVLISPLNSIVDDVLIRLAEKEGIVLNPLNSGRNKMHKLNMLFRFDILHSLLDILQKFGREPTFENQKWVAKLIKDPLYGGSALTTQRNKAILITGFSDVFFLTLPELFVQWSTYKDADKSKQPQESPVNFEKQECLWPTFSKPPGCMDSNGKSPKPYSFLPVEIFNFEKLFKDCLEGKIVWITPTLENSKKPKEKINESRAKDQESPDVNKNEADKIDAKNQLGRRHHQKHPKLYGIRKRTPSEAGSSPKKRVKMIATDSTEFQDELKGLLQKLDGFAFAPQMTESIEKMKIFLENYHITALLKEKEKVCDQEDSNKEENSSKEKEIIEGEKEASEKELSEPQISDKEDLKASSDNS